MIAALLLTGLMATATADLTSLKREYLSLLEEKSKRQAERSLRAFVTQAWPLIEGDTPFVSNWHIDAICDHLEAVTRGEIQRLLINMPPACGKSDIVSVLWPAWEWASNPQVRYLCASYDQALSTRDTRRCRDVVLSPWFQSRWPLQIRADQNQKIRFDTAQGGWRIGTSVGGRGTGEHPDRIIIDDPHNAKKAESDADRQSVIDWFSGTLSTRGATRDRRMVIVMQRLHERDLSAHVLAEERRELWTHLCLPMRYEPRRMRSTVIGWTDPRTQPDQLLWPVLYTPERLKPIETELGSYGIASQFQQRPAPAEGGILKRAWWKYYAPESVREKTNLTGPIHFRSLVISCDPNLRAKAMNDFAALQLWGATSADRYLLWADRDRWETPELTRRIKDLYTRTRERWPNLGIQVLIENTAAGPDVISVLSRQIPGVLAIRPEGDKVQRAEAITPMLEAGNVFLPGAGAPDGSGCDTSLTPLWVQEFIDQCASFPMAEHDDDVDAMTQALIRLLRRAEFSSANFAHVDIG